MRKVTIGTEKYTRIFSKDEKGNGNAYHEYIIQPINGEQNPPLTSIHFQNGFIKENGINGCQNEDLIAIIIDRLQCFNEGKYNCRENSIAITKLEEALLWLNKRTRDRELRNVEGTNIV